MNRLRLARYALRRKSPTPLGAVARGFVAGAIGSGVQSLFFKLVKAPKPTRLPEGEGKPEGNDVSALQAVATRLEGMTRRDLGDKSRVASAIHVLFGAMWGGVYGLVRESFRMPPQLFGVLVWALSDNVLLPAFRLAAWPNRYSAREHRYAVQAHLAYGLATAGSYAALRDLGPIPLSAVPAMLALQAWAFVMRMPPGRAYLRAQPWTKRFLHGTLVQKAALA